MRKASGRPAFARRYHGVRDPLNDSDVLAKLIKAAAGGDWDRRVILTDEPFVGLRSMDESWANRFCVNAVAPGVIDTDMSNFAKTDEGKTFVLGMQALKRIGQPDDVGPVVAFLASDDARWITGDTIRVDGGSKL
jgi:Enoyl-(Acyl carrier protein) reductase